MTRRTQSKKKVRTQHSHRLRHGSVDEPSGNLLGQRSHGELLQDPQGRTCSPNTLRDPSACAFGCRQLDRGVLQSSPATLIDWISVTDRCWRQLACWLPEVVRVESRQVTKAPALLRDCFCHDIRPDTTHSKGPPPATNQQSTANQAASPAERLCPDPE